MKAAQRKIYKLANEIESVLKQVEIKKLFPEDTNKMLLYSINHLINNDFINQQKESQNVKDITQIDFTKLVKGLEGEFYLAVDFNGEERKYFITPATRDSAIYLLDFNSLIKLTNPQIEIGSYMTSCYSFITIVNNLTFGVELNKEIIERINEI